MGTAFTSRHLLIALIVIFEVSCVRPPQTEPDLDYSKPVSYTIPLRARPQDLVCAETFGAQPNLCMTNRRFRQLLTDAYVEP